jgi:intein/homing endonuclease
MSGKKVKIEQPSAFDIIRENILNLDVIHFVETYLTVDGAPFRLTNNGYKPFVDIYRYIALKAIEPDAKPVVLVKGRQVGATTMAAALECYFMACGLFGNNGRAPMRIGHMFPTLSLAAAYTKTKLDPMLSSSKPMPGVLKNNGMLKSFMESRLDTSSPANNNMHFKLFKGGNLIFVESTGVDGDRIRGRQLALDTELPTPNGFIKLDDVKEGDHLFDEEGNICTVTKVHPTNLTPEAYKITFDDGTIVEACAEHLWSTHTKSERRFKKAPTVKNTKEIFNTLQVRGESNHSIKTCSPVKYEEKNLLVDPYLLGLWLGDGSRGGQIESADPEIFNGLNYRVIKSTINNYNKGSFSKSGLSKSSSYRVLGLTTALTKLGLISNPGKIKKENGDLGFYNKRIPEEYMRSSVEQRLALLQGLMDSDGCCSVDGRCEFVQVESRKELAYQILELIQSLGIKTSIIKAEGYRYEKRYQDKYRIQFYTTLPVFRLARKLVNLKSKINKSGNRYIKNIEPISSRPMKCITVDSTSSLYLITRAFIPTHNTMDCALFDECFPYDQNIETENGKIKIGKLYDMLSNKKELPLVKTYNEATEQFEYKKITNAWCRGEKELIRLTCGNRKIECTPNHRFLTAVNGWKMASELLEGDLLRATPAEINQISKSLNEDQMQIMLGSFLGDGHIANSGLNRYRIREVHGIKQENYCTWKANIFNSKPTVIEKNGYSQKPALVFSSKLFGLAKKFPKIKTTCPQWVLDDLDARGLAVWFMDDGSACNNQGGGTIHTCSFDEDSQKRMVAKLQSFGIDCEYRFYNKKKTGYFSIFINKKGYLKLCDIIRPYIHPDLFYKIHGANEQTSNYKWDNVFNNYGLVVVDKIEDVLSKKIVYDIEVEDNHNFIVTSVRRSKNIGGIIAHNCQDIPSIALGAVTKVLAQAHYGFTGDGVQVYFGTPKQKGTNYHNMWKMAEQHYYHLRCESCEGLFPLYRPDVNWEDIWLYGKIVKCTECGHEQEKTQAAERGQWVRFGGADPKDSKYIGYHINQLYIPHFTKETILGQKPEKNPNNTERIYQNEVLGEFYDGDGSLISPEEIYENCGDIGRQFTKSIGSHENKMVYLGMDWGQRGALDQLAGRQRGQSYSCAVVLTAETPNRFIVEFATRLQKVDPQSKLDVVDEMFRRYSIQVAVGDIGDAYDLTHVLQRKYFERFLASRAAPKVIGHVKFTRDIFPKEIVFERDYYYSELMGLLKSGAIRFPMGQFEEVSWLINHCCSMDVRANIGRQGDPIRRYIKGPSPNDGFASLLNAYLAYKFHITQGFKITQPALMKYEIAKRNAKIPAVLGYMPKRGQSS